MCGLCGCYRHSGTVDPDAVRSMNRVISHRGPDGDGIWSSGNHRCELGHRRLAIIDLEGGKQPLVSFDGRYVVVSNGEIYNYRELKSTLESEGATFLTNSDTEVIGEAYRRWGRECLSRFSGMFAIAIYDTRNEELLLARDRTGIKPLYYYTDSLGVIFGSEMKALLQHQRVPRKINSGALADYLTLGYPLVPATFFQDIYELEPGSWLLATPRGVESGRYWDWSRQAEEWNQEELLAATQESFEESVREHLVSDVPVGAFLSGGVDSTLIVSQMAEIMERRPDTFTVRFAENEYNEADQAKEIAKQLGTCHHEIQLKENEIDVDLVEKVMGHFDQPFGDSSAIPTYLISREIRKHVKVVVSGDGGDEMFGGYPRFRHADVARQVGRLPSWCLNGAEALSHSVGNYAPAFARKSSRFLRAARQRHGGRLVSLSSYFPPDRMGEVLHADWEQKTGNSRHELFQGRYPRQGPGGLDFIDTTIRYALPGDYLRKVDMMSSAHGVEVRVPFLGTSILRLASRLPRECLYSKGTSKVALRLLLRQRISKQVAKLPKRGFEIPLDTCLGREGRDYVAKQLTSSKSLISGIVRPDFMARLLEGFQTRQWDRRECSRFGMYQRVYLLWSLEHWLQTWKPSM